MPADCVNGLEVLDNAPTDHRQLTHLAIVVLREQSNGDHGVTNGLLIEHIELVDPRTPDRLVIHEMLHRLYCERTGQISMERDFG